MKEAQLLLEKLDDRLLSNGLGSGLVGPVEDGVVLVGLVPVVMVDAGALWMIEVTDAGRMALGSSRRLSSWGDT